MYDHMKSIRICSHRQTYIISFINDVLEKSFGSKVEMESAQVQPHHLRKHASLLLYSSNHTHLPFELLILKVIAANIAGKFPHFESSLSSIRHSAILYKKMR